MTELQITSLLDKKLAKYGLLGAAVLGVNGAAKADMVYVNNVDFSANDTSAQNSYTLNLSGPAANDITISANATTLYGGTAAAYYVEADAGTNAAIQFKFLDYPAANASGAVIDPTAVSDFNGGGPLTDSEYSPLNGSFTTGKFPSDGSDAYLGFYYTAADGNHAGWIDIATSSSANSDLSGSAAFEVLDYAYDTTPNQAIYAGGGVVPEVAATPEPSTLSLLAMGATGVAALRRRYASKR